MGYLFLIMEVNGGSITEAYTIPLDVEIFQRKTPTNIKYSRWNFGRTQYTDNDGTLGSISKKSLTTDRRYFNLTGTHLLGRYVSYIIMIHEFLSFTHACK